MNTGNHPELLKKALNLFDPARPLSGQELDDYYVSRPHAPLEPMKTYLRNSEQRVKVLFSGHRGSGKSTELARLARDLEKEFFVVPVSARSLDLSDLSYVDVMLACAAGLFLKATAKGGPVKIPSELLKDVLEWLGSEITQDTSVTISKTGSLGARLSALIFNLQGKYSKETSTRSTVRENLYVRVRDLIQRMDAVCEEVEKEFEPPLIVFEDIDKADLELARALFFEHATTLNGPACRIIYTFPISLRHSNEFAPRRRDYSHDFCLPNVSLYEKDGSVSKNGCDTLRSVIERRVSPKIFQEDAFNQIVEMSGGLMIDLVRLVSDAALVALTDKAKLITRKIVDRVAAEMANDYRRILLPEHYEALRQAHKTKEIKEVVPSETGRELLANQSLLEYCNEKAWWDVHPTVKGLL